MNALLVWLDDALYRWGGPLYSWTMRAKGYVPCRFDERGIPATLDAHADDCRFVQETCSGGWVRCAPDCAAPREDCPTPRKSVCHEP